MSSERVGRTNRSTKVLSLMSECVSQLLPFCAHAIMVHSAVAITASGRKTMYFLILALIF